MSTKQHPQARVGTRVPRPRKDGRSNRITTTKARARGAYTLAGYATAYRAGGAQPQERQPSCGCAIEYCIVFLETIGFNSQSMTVIENPGAAPCWRIGGFFHGSHLPCLGQNSISAFSSARGSNCGPTTVVQGACCMAWSKEVTASWPASKAVRRGRAPRRPKGRRKRWGRDNGGWQDDAVVVPMLAALLPSSPAWLCR